MLKQFIIIFSLLILYTCKAYSQLPETDIIEDISGTEKDEVDYTTLFDNLNYYYNNPININTTTKEELEKLQLLNEIQINNLINYLKKYSYMISIYELYAINGFDSKTIKLISPYIKVSPILNKTINIKNALKYGRSELVIKSQQALEMAKGYLPVEETSSDNNIYLGSPLKLYTRYRFKYKDNVSMGILGEKDAGEEFFKGTQKKGFDFYSAHIFIKNIWKLKSLAIGDYYLQFGQGLTLWSGSSYSKTYNVINIKKYAQGIKPYVSSNENLFMRGIATNFEIKNINCYMFFSHHKIDANVTKKDSATNKVLNFSSLQNTGYHTTYSEIEDKDAISQTIFGTNINYKKANYKIGLTAYNMFFDAEQILTETVYNKFYFKGKNNLNVGMDYSFNINKTSFFGELATSKNGEMAYLNGMICELAPFLNISVLQRSYSREYQNLNCNAFSENTSNQNEDGIYLGATIYPSKDFIISAYYDFYKFPWLKYQVYSPSYGDDYIVQLNYSPSQKLEMYFKIKENSKFSNSTELFIPSLEKNIKRYYRYNIVYQLSESLKLKNRVEWLENRIGNHTKHTGYLIFQDIGYKFKKRPITFSFRYAMFDTDNYDTRIYAYENDVLYAFSVPAYYYKGTGTYLIFKYDLNDDVDIWIKYGITYYKDLYVIGTGLNETKGNTKSQIKFQIRYVF